MLEDFFKLVDLTRNGPMFNCSDGGTTYIVGEIIAKDNLNLENLMHTFENLLLQNYLTKFLDIAHK